MQKKSADIHNDLNQWMLQRNYESLKEASQHLHETLQKHKEGMGGAAGRTPKTPEDNSEPSIEESTQKLKKNAAIRSLKNIQGQALAALVVRKNLMNMRDKALKGKPKAKEPVKFKKDDSSMEDNDDDL